MRYYLNKLFYLILAGFLWGCGNSAPVPQATGRYFSLDGYFKSEMERLSSKQPMVEKTVEKNGTVERRSLANLDWALELKVFRSSDINKPAWHNSYSIDSSETGLVYRAKEPDLRVRSVQITFGPGGAVTGILIRRSESNYLYTSGELLKYYPDSLYFIERHQEVRVLGPDEFRVSGRF